MNTNQLHRPSLLRRWQNARGMARTQLSIVIITLAIALAAFLAIVISWLVYENSPDARVDRCQSSALQLYPDVPIGLLYGDCLDKYKPGWREQLDSAS
jgi:hypothetical protein